MLGCNDDPMMTMTAAKYRLLGTVRYLIESLQKPYEVDISIRIFILNSINIFKILNIVS